MTTTSSDIAAIERDFGGFDEFSQACINKTLKELQDEQAGVAHLV